MTATSEERFFSEFLTSSIVVAGMFLPQKKPGTNTYRSEYFRPQIYFISGAKMELVHNELRKKTESQLGCLTALEAVVQCGDGLSQAKMHELNVLGARSQTL